MPNPSKISGNKPSGNNKTAARGIKGPQKSHFKKKQKTPEEEAKQRRMRKRNEVKAQKAAELEAERQRLKLEKEKGIKDYRKKRLEKVKIISKKTRRGQPLMKDRMQLLLKQIQDMKRC